MIGGVPVSILSLLKMTQGDVRDLWVWIGPCIQRQSYRFSQKPVQSGIGNWDSFIVKEVKDGKDVWYIDLPGFATSASIAMGIDPAQIISDGRDTYTQDDMFFSHTRYTETRKQKGNFAIGVQLQ